jgi:hypothetical protein
LKRLRGFAHVSDYNRGQEKRRDVTKDAIDNLSQIAHALEKPRDYNPEHSKPLPDWSLVHAEPRDTGVAVAGVTLFAYQGVVQRSNGWSAI